MSNLPEFLTTGRILTAIYAFLIVVGGVILATLVRNLLRRLLPNRVDPQVTSLVCRFVYFGFLMLAFSAALHQLGFKIGVLLGAAGILTVAVGFAAQTSASNLISGIFVIAERPFVVGDIIKVDDVTGELLSIDLLSLKLRTFDNLYVRVPNELVIKSKVTNFTHFPIRRLDILMGVAYREDIERVNEILLRVAYKNTICLDEPKPIFIFQKFGDSALEFQFSVWSRRENFLDLRNSIHFEIKAALDDAGVEIPFPHRTILVGKDTDTFPVRLNKGE